MMKRGAHGRLDDAIALAHNDRDLPQFAVHCGRIGALISERLGDQPGARTAAQLGASLFNQYFYPFEIVSLALVAAMAGAVLLAKRHLEG